MNAIDQRVVIVGAGPTGLSLSAELHRLGEPRRSWTGWLPVKIRPAVLGLWKRFEAVRTGRPPTSRNFRRCSSTSSRFKNLANVFADPVGEICGGW
jgi:cation diffusion facilitator CzcD-associated flavoprotein CzcO